MAHRVQSRQEQLFFPQPLGQELARTSIQPKNSSGGAPQRQLQNSIEAYEHLVMLGKLQQAAEDAHAQLDGENGSLKQQIAQRTELLESEWLSKAEAVSSKVDVIYHKLTQFHREFSAEYQKAHSLCLKACSGNSNEFKLGLCDRKKTEVRDFNLDEAIATRLIYLIYSHIDDDRSSKCRFEENFESKTLLTPRIPKKIEELHQTIRDSLKAAVKAEVPKMRAEMLNQESCIDVPSGLQLIAASPVNENDFGDAFHSFVQKLQVETEAQEEHNRLSRKENKELKNKISQLEKVDKRFLKLFHAHLHPLFTLIGISEGIISLCQTAAQNAAPALEKLSPRDPYCGYYVGKLLMGKKVFDHFNEILSLVETLQKEFSL